MPIVRFAVFAKNIPGEPVPETAVQGRPVAAGGRFRHWL